MYSKNIHSKGSSPNSCGIFSVDYDAMNPEENERFTNTKTHRFTQKTHTKTLGTPSTTKNSLLHTTNSREKDAYGRFRLVPPEHTLATLAQLWA